MKKLLVIMSVLLLMLVACSENDNDNDGDNYPAPELATTADVVISIPDSIEIANYVGIEIDYNGTMVTGYFLGQFVTINKDFNESLEYAIEIVASDDYSPRTGGNPDLSIGDFVSGYLLPSEKYRTFFPDEMIETAYDVKYADHLNLYRAVTITDEDAESIIVELGAFETSMINHQAGDGNFYEDAGFKLENLISEYVTDEPGEFSYNFTNSDLDKSSHVYSWEEIQSAYWLVEQNKAVFLNEDGTESQSSFKHLIMINLLD